MKLKDLILDRLDVSIVKLSEKTGVTRQTIANILNEDHKPSLLTTKKICEYFKVNFREYIE